MESPPLSLNITRQNGPREPPSFEEQSAHLLPFSGYLGFTYDPRGPVSYPTLYFNLSGLLPVDNLLAHWPAPIQMVGSA